jgi:hypothetical protein
VLRIPRIFHLPSIVSEGSNLFQPVFGIVVKPLKTLLAVGLCKQAFSQLCAFCSPKSGSVSGIEIFRQLQRQDELLPGFNHSAAENINKDQVVAEGTHVAEAAPHRPRLLRSYRFKLANNRDL